MMRCREHARTAVTRLGEALCGAFGSSGCPVGTRACAFSALSSPPVPPSASASSSTVAQARRRFAQPAYTGIARSWSSASSSSRPPPRTTNSYNVSYTSLVLAGVTGAGLYYYFEKIKSDRHARAALKGAQHAKVAGQADIGGPFKLVDSATNKPFSSDQLKGGYSLLYFGFTHCPDICPDELEKIASAVDIVEKESKGNVKLTPVFITLDPERDGVREVAPYVKEFHPRMIGLTGSKDEIMKVTKSYRVYFTKAGVAEITENDDGAGPGQDDDYLIDHSIITYLLDKEGQFVTFFGKNYTDAEMARSLLNIIEQ